MSSSSESENEKMEIKKNIGSIYLMITILCLINFLSYEGPAIPDPEPSPKGMNGPAELHYSHNTWMEEQCLQEAQRFYEYLLKRGNPYGADMFLKEYYPDLVQ